MLYFQCNEMYLRCQAGGSNGVHFKLVGNSLNPELIAKFLSESPTNLKCTGSNGNAARSPFAQREEW